MFCIFFFSCQSCIIYMRNHLCWKHHLKNPNDKPTFNWKMRLSMIHMPFYLQELALHMFDQFHDLRLVVLVTYIIYKDRYYNSYASHKWKLTTQQIFVRLCSFWWFTYHYLQGAFALHFISAIQLFLFLKIYYFSNDKIVSCTWLIICVDGAIWGDTNNSCIIHEWWAHPLFACQLNLKNWLYVYLCCPTTWDLLFW